MYARGFETWCFSETRKVHVCTYIYFLSFANMYVYGHGGEISNFGVNLFL